MVPKPFLTALVPLVLGLPVFSQYAHFDPNYGPGGLSTIQVEPGESSHRYGGCLDSQGRIIQFGVTNNSINVASENAASIIRWLPDGQPDLSYGTNGRLIVPGVTIRTGALFPSGRMMAYASHGQPMLLRLTPEGEPDVTFGNNGYLPAPFPPVQRWSQMVSTRDGRIIFAYDNAAIYHVVMIREDGTLDPSFGDQGVFTAPTGKKGIVFKLVEDDDGNFLIGGMFADASQAVAPGLFRLTSSGELDTAFGIGGFTRYGDLGTSNSCAVLSMLLEPDGSFYAGGGRALGNNGSAMTLAKFLPNGELDPAIPNNGAPLPPIANETRRLHIIDLAHDVEGRVIAFGNLRPEGTSAPRQPAWACYNPDFTLDQAFGDQGLLRIEGTMWMHYEAWILRLDNGDLVANSYFARAPINVSLAGISRLSHDLTTMVDGPGPGSGSGLYPNPAKDHIMVPGSPLKRAVNYTLHDITGKVVQAFPSNTGPVENDRVRLELPGHLPSGLYLLATRSAGALQRTERFVIEH